MSKPNIIQFRELSAFANDLSTMRIVERDTPKGSDLFFKELLKEPFNVSKEIFQSNSLEDIEFMLNRIIPSKLKNNNFFYFWLKDMANITSVFSQIIKEKSICLALETSRGELALALSLGITLISLAVVINLLIHIIKNRYL